MKQFCVIGFPLSHSFSPDYFQKKFENLGLKDHNYFAQEIMDVSAIRSLIMSKSLFGCNVTIPHKQSVISQIDELDPIAAEIGSVNCVKVYWNENTFTTKGFNTDWIGFAHLLKKLKKKPKKAMVLGSGGAALAVHFALKNEGIGCLSVSRKATENSISYQDIDANLMAEYDLVVNTTPLGMFPKTEEKPFIPYQLLTSSHVLIDLIYNPLRTAFLREGERRSCQVVNGMEMLQIQAEASWEIWMSPQL